MCGSGVLKLGLISYYPAQIFNMDVTMKLSPPLAGSFVYKGSPSLYLLTSVLLLLLSSYSFSAEREDYDLDDNRLIEINDLADLDEIRNNLDGSSLYGSSAGCPESGCNGFELTTDLDFDTNADGVMDKNDAYWQEGAGWSPIGSNEAPVNTNFDGKGHTIRNLYINRRGHSGIGFFAYLNDAYITNIHFSGPLTYVRGHTGVGVIAGHMTHGRIYHSSAEGEVIAYQSAGLLAGAGFDGSRIEHSSSRGKVSASALAGGLVGRLVGQSRSNTVQKSRSSANVAVTSSRVGGLVGELNGWSSVYYSFSTGNVSGGNTAGGLVGKAEGISIEREDGSFAHYYSDINASFFTGTVLAGSYVGGLVGELLRFSRMGYSFSSGFVNNTSSQTGALIGRSQSNAAITRSYWAADTSNQIDSVIYQLNGEGLPIASLQCATMQNVTIENSVGCLPALDENGDANEQILFNNWDAYKYYDHDAGIQKPYWVFGTDQQLPGLDLEGTIYRDSDGDGSLDEDDAWPFLAAAKIDSDGDGYPDVWNIGCDLVCQVESGLIIDQLPESPEAWLDEDLDGKPDAWADSCDIDCQNTAIANSLELDTNLNDFDNDGLTAENDRDENGDGIKDRDSDHDGLIEIHNLAELDAVRNNLTGTGFVSELNGEVDSSGCPIKLINGEYIQECIGYELMNNLDFDTNQDGLQNSSDIYYNDRFGWLPIGTLNPKFSAVFDGNGYTIKNLFINRPDEDYIGLFSTFDKAEVRNLNIDTQFQIKGKSTTGTLVGYATNSQIENISVNSRLSAGNSTGGLIGYAVSNNTIINCRTAGSVSSDDAYAGGLIGYAHISNQVRHSFSSSSVQGRSYSGGLIGRLFRDNAIEASYATGNVNGYKYVGGLIGELQFSNSLVASYAMGVVYSSSSEVGGLVGSLGRDNTITYSYASGSVVNRINSGGLIGRIEVDNNSISNSYWATDSTTQLTSASSSDETNYIGLTLTSLQCAITASETAAANGCVFDNGNEAVALPEGIELYNDWTLAGENNAAGEFVPFWHFGTNQQLPVLVNQQVLRRDSDGDGVFDQNDVYIDIPLGNREDTDNDGAPDFCSTACIAEGMVADIDIDGDGANNDVDVYPTIPLNGLEDADNDGIPNECDYYCQQRGLVADADDDNDLIPDAIDAFPAQFETAVDADKDGLADAWTDVCNVECQNASGIVLDFYLNDFDNDGLIDGEGFDTDLTADNGLPELLTIPTEGNARVDNEEGTSTTFNFSAQLIDTLSATDVVDDSLIYEANIAEQVILIDPAKIEMKHIVLPSGRQTITWTAIDDAGNRSNSLEQIVNVYPRVRFSASYSEVEENTVANIGIELTAPSPHYPVSFEVRVDAEKTTLDNNDLVSSAEIDLVLPLLVSMTAGNDESLNTQVNLVLPIAQDNVSESKERISLELVGASDEINTSQYFTNINSALTYTLDIREESFDDDGDGILDINDAFSLNAAASIDSDKDGQPDSWNENCDFECYNNSNLTLDLDDDNDGTADAEDLYPLNAAVAIDDDSDGLPDEWAPGCDLACQNNSGFILDQYPNDSDNDGLINALDSQHGIDSGKPVLISVPGEMSSAVNSADALHAKINIDMASLQMFSATDAVDSSLYFRPLWNGSDLAYENGDFELPIGRHVIQWVAIDDAGNRSNPMEQIINVYPEVKHSSLISTSGEGSAAQIHFELTGPSPIYPVTVGLQLNFDDASANRQDIQSPENVSNFTSKVHYIEINAGQGNMPNTKGIFELPISSDGIDENDEVVMINLKSIRGPNVQPNYFGIVGNQFQHTLTITDENLAPAVTLEILQRGIFVDEVNVDDGEVIIRAMVNDPNGDDWHAYEWDLAQLGLNMEVTNTIRLDPANWLLGEHEISLNVTDSGNPSMTTDLTRGIKVIESEDEVPEEPVPEEPVPEEPNSEEQAPENEGEGNEAEEGESPVDQGGEGSPEQENPSAESSGSGALAYLLCLLLILAIYQRQRAKPKRFLIL